MSRDTTAFALGVAAGDPAPDGILLWTRISPGPGTSARLTWEIARDQAMRQVVARGHATAEARHDWTVKVRIRAAALQPFTTYWYRFRAFGVYSRVGRFKTLPAAGQHLEQLTLACISCQDFTSGRFNALRKLADANVDFVLHLGDYIYETVSDDTFQDRGPASRRLRLPDGIQRAQTLGHYRFLYRTYRSDPDLQLLHERFAVIAIWDDHEFANDGYGVHDTDGPDEADNADPARRSAASQAWSEYLPADVAFDLDSDPLEQIRIYRSFVFGDLAELVVTDERLYRDGPPCGLARRQRYATRGCAGQAAPDRTMMGAPQRDWLIDRLTTSTRRWKLWGNETMLMPFKLPGWLAHRLHPHDGAVPLLDDVYVSLDQWDGYLAERAQLIAALAAVEGLVVLTGDLHSFIAGTLRGPTGDVVANCLMVGSVSSANLVEMIARRTLPSLPLPLGRLVRSVNPHLDYVNSSAHGFNIVQLQHDRLRCRMVAVSGVRLRPAFAWTLRTIEIAHQPRRAVAGT